jgi:hypothetical protein
VVVLPVLPVCSLSMRSAELVARVTFFFSPSLCAALICVPWCLFRLCCFRRTSGFFLVASCVSSLLCSPPSRSRHVLSFGRISNMFSHSLASRFVSRPIFFVYRFSLTSNQSSSSLIFFVYLGLINFVPRVLLALPASEMCSLKGFSFFLFFCGSTVCFSRVISLCHRDLRLGVLSTGICFQVAYYCTD